MVVPGLEGRRLCADLVRQLVVVGVAGQLRRLPMGLPRRDGFLNGVVHRGDGFLPPRTDHLPDVLGHRGTAMEDV